MPTVDAIFAGTITQSTTATACTALAPTADFLSIILAVSAMSGDSAAATFRIQWSVDGGTWAEASPPDAFEPITEPTAVVKRFPVKAKYWRAVCELAGTDPTFTGSANCYS